MSVCAWIRDISRQGEFHHSVLGISKDHRVFLCMLQQSLSITECIRAFSLLRLSYFLPAQSKYSAIHSKYSLQVRQLYQNLNRKKQQDENCH